MSPRKKEEAKTFEENMIRLEEIVPPLQLGDDLLQAGDIFLKGLVFFFFSRTHDSPSSVIVSSTRHLSLPSASRAVI